MKRLMLTALAAGIVLTGCGGPKASDPKSVSGKDDPRIQRANTGGGTTQQQGMIKSSSGKSAE